MLKTMTGLVLAVGAFSATASAAPSPPTYDIYLKVFERGEIISEPRLTVKSGESATFMTGIGSGGWSAKIIGTPDKDPGRIQLALDIASWSSELDSSTMNVQRSSSIIVVDAGARATSVLKGNPIADRVEITAVEVKPVQPVVATPHVGQ